MAGEAPAGGAQLTAYAVPAAGAAPRGAELRTFLAATLPEYMLPAAVVVLAELPRTPTGKVDRQALPRPDLGELEAGGVPAVPRNIVEEMLSEIWRDLLKVERLGVHDNFFTLGGQSRWRPNWSPGCATASAGRSRCAASSSAPRSRS